MNVERGDVIWMDLQNPPGGVGREQSGKRPTILMSSGGESSSNPMITIIPLTSILQSQRFLYTYFINPTAQNGLDCQSIALVFQIRSLDKNRIIRKAGHLEANHISQLESLLRQLLLI